MIDEQGRPEPPLAASPVEMVAAFVDFQRATLLWKVGGLDEATLRRQVTTSGVCLLGVVKHAAYVERWWFQRVFAGHKVFIPWRDTTERDADWRIDPTDSAESVVAFYQQECAISRQVITGRDWMEVATRADDNVEPFTLGWIMSHMLEEIARHVGQVDILREQIDGLTGE